MVSRTLQEELERVLAPLAGNDPTGQRPPANDHRSPLAQFNMTHDEAIAGERRAEDIRASGDEDEQHRLVTIVQTSLKHWEQVGQAGLRLLAEEWKDLEVLAKVTQALVRTHGVAGLSFGYRAATGLLTRYWDQFASRANSNLAEQLRPLASLNGTLAAPLRRVPVTAAGTPYWRGQRAFDLEGELAKHAGESKEEREQRFRQRRLRDDDVAEFRRQVADTPGEFYGRLAEDIATAITVLEDFRRTVGSQLDESPQPAELPPTSEIERTLQEVLLLVRGIAGDKLSAAGTGANQPPPSASVTPGSAPPSAPSVHDEPRDRNDAFRQLEVIATFFERTEPQSLLPAQIRRVIRQGQLTPREFFEELIEDPAARDKLFKTLGLVSSPAGAKST
jgi:type VI secretion system protein ImpA